MPTIVRINPATERHPTSGLSANRYPISEPWPSTGKAYLVGGFTGSQFATAILRYAPPGTTTVVARLPQGTRYAGVAAIGRTIYVAGGLTTSGASRAIYALPLGGKLRDIGRLPKPEDHAALAAVNGNALLRRRPQDPRDQPAHGQVDDRRATSGLALRPDRNDAREGDRHRRRRDERDLDLYALAPLVRRALPEDAAAAALAQP